MFNKNKLFAVIFIPYFLITACSGSLPTRQDNTPGTGVIAIPVSMESNDVHYAIGWVIDAEIRDSSSSAVGEPVRLRPYEGRKFVFVSDLQPGEYHIKRIRSVSVGSGAINGGIRPFRDLTSAINFEIHADTVSVLPTIFHYERRSTASGYNTRYEYKELSTEIDQFKTTLSKSRNIEGWKIIWPQ